MENPIKMVLAAALSAQGFSRETTTWRRGLPEVLQVVSLQKSQFGNRYYINFALWLKALGSANDPKEQQCHVRVRQSALAPELSALERALDLDDSALGSDARLAILEEFARGPLSLAVEACGDLAGARSWFVAGRFRAGIISSAARDLLERN